MQYENIPTVRLMIIAEIYGLTDAELRAHSNLQPPPGKRSTTRQLLDVARSLAVPRQDGGKQVLFETSYGVRRYLEPSLRCFSLDAPLPHTNPHTNDRRSGGSRTAGQGGAEKCTETVKYQVVRGTSFTKV